MSEHEEYTLPPGMRVASNQGANPTKLQPVLIDPSIAIVEGDVPARQADGSWVPTAASGGGSGVLVEVYGETVGGVGVGGVLSLDPDDGSRTHYFYRAGLTLNEAKNAFVVQTAGRYRISGWVQIDGDADTPSVCAFQAVTTPNTAANLTRQYLPAMGGLTGSVGPTVSLPGSCEEFAVGDTIAFQFGVNGPERTINDGLVCVQYEGPSAP